MIIPTPSTRVFPPRKKNPLSLAFALDSRVTSEMVPAMRGLEVSWESDGVMRWVDTESKNFTAGRELGGHQSNLSLKEKILSPKEVK